jgi:hypothetical protein
MNRRVADGKTTVNRLHLSCIAHEIKRINSCGRNGEAVSGQMNEYDVVAEEAEPRTQTLPFLFQGALGPLDKGLITNFI